jgi:hypothetical protein
MSQIRIKLIDNIRGHKTELTNVQHVQPRYRIKDDIGSKYILKKQRKK